MGGFLDERAALSGKVAVLVGGGGGIGAAASNAQASAGVDQAICDIDVLPSGRVFGSDAVSLAEWADRVGGPAADGADARSEPVGGVAVGAGPVGDRRAPPGRGRRSPRLTRPDRLQP